MFLVQLRRDGKLKSLAAEKARRRHARRIAAERVRDLQADVGAGASHDEDSDSDSSSGESFTEARRQSLGNTSGR